MTQICEDLVVIELGEGSVAGSEVGMFLADNGARVIKVEPPDGDPLRRSIPSGSLVWNRGKESLVADLSKAEDIQAVKDLLAAADVVVEALAAGEAESLGIGYDDVRQGNANVVYCSIKGFGPAGPYAGIHGYDGLVMAKAGAFARGDFGFRPGPIFSGALVASNGAAHQAVSGTLAALIVRDRTGAGQRVDASLFAGLGPMDYFMSYHYQLGRLAPPPAGDDSEAKPARRTPAATRYMVSACTRDGRWMFFSPQLPHQAKALIRVLELDSMLEEERFKDMPAFWTLEDAADWENLIFERVKERDMSVWVERALADNDLPFEPVLSPEEALDHPQMRANGNVVTVEDPVHGPVEQIGPLASFSLTPSVIERSAPDLGRHGEVPGPRATTTVEGSLPAHALDGVTIVEFGYFFAMPYGVTMAGALGARIIKVEGLEGDPMRWSFGGPEWGSMKTMEGKESIAVDMRSEAGREVMRKLLERADVFVQGFRPGVDARLGVDYEAVRQINPGIVYVHGAGYGSSGPYAHRPIYAGTAMAASGSVHRQAAHWLEPELNASLDAMSAQVVVAPRMRNQTDGDSNAAVGVLSAILFGLRHKLRTGEGQFVATSMVGGNVLAYSDDFNRYDGKVPVRQADAEQYGTSATYRLYEAGEGWVFLGATKQHEWETAMTAAGRRDLVTDDRFLTSEARDSNETALTSALTELFRTRPAAEWEELMIGQGANCVAVSEAPQYETVVSDPKLREMGLMSEVDHPRFGRLLRYGPPAVLSATPGRTGRASIFAEHTAEVLQELGYSEDEITKLADAGVVRLAD